MNSRSYSQSCISYTLFGQYKVHYPQKQVFESHPYSSVTTPISQEGQSERTLLFCLFFLIFPLFSNFPPHFPDFFLFFPMFLQIFHCQGGHSAPLPPHWLHHCIHLACSILQRLKTVHKLIHLHKGLWNCSAISSANRLYIHTPAILELEQGMERHWTSITSCPNFIQKKLGFLYRLEVLAWVMTTCWVLHSRLIYF